ncbi:hypothetical protein [Sorangium sp. So ce1153]|uniref:hypothetical protein n=1 Tax=Sorangium sp. So ce1153 TaxID=3133333 RepID=UPI003F61881F
MPSRASPGIDLDASSTLAQAGGAARGRVWRRQGALRAGERTTEGEEPHDDDRTTLDDGFGLTLMTAACGSSDAPGTYSTVESPAPIKATHTQRQYYEGYLVPYILYGIKHIGLDATKTILAPLMVDEFRVNTGLDVVMATDIDAYNDHLDALGVNQ